MLPDVPVRLPSPLSLEACTCMPANKSLHARGTRQCCWTYLSGYPGYMAHSHACLAIRACMLAR